MGFKNDSSVRALLNENTAENKNKARATAEILKKELAEKGLVGVVTGTPGIAPRTSLDAIMHQDVFLNGIHGLPLICSASMI